MSDRNGVLALAALAARREAGLRAALTRLTAATRAAGDALASCEREHERRRGAWQRALACSGVYARREAVQASRAVERERAALAEALSRQRAAYSHLQQAEAELRQQRERLHANARKQEKLRELLAQLR
jgi:small-conductance mechanosensitive channel